MLYFQPPAFLTDLLSFVLSFVYCRILSQAAPKDTDGAIVCFLSDEKGLRALYSLTGKNPWVPSPVHFILPFPQSRYLKIQIILHQPELKSHSGDKNGYMRKASLKTKPSLRVKIKVLVSHHI
jgi:hypothetical protein